MELRGLMTLVVVIVAGCSSSPSGGQPGMLPRSPALRESRQATLVPPAREAQIGSRTWTTKAPMPDGRYLFGLAASGGRLYAMGGISSALEIIDRVIVYDPTSDTWSRAAPMPKARCGFGVGVVN